eukprot:INCI10583.1.p1 GENE.INCI10583.1~~INCI10583.1.p1  ORF type:complete len:211 (-),score=30.98 INCI10583.1:211-843(-)
MQSYFYFFPPSALHALSCPLPSSTLLFLFLPPHLTNMAEASEVCRAFRNTGRCRYGESCKYEHSEGDAIEPPPRGQCFNFEQDGECEYGDRCRYLHGEEDGSRFEKKRKPRKPRGPRKEAGAEEEVDGEDRPARARKPRRKPRRKARVPGEKLDEDCNNYAAGRCRYGENCSRRHVGDVEQHVEKIDEVCNNFLEGRCQFGDLCRRVHQE